MNRFLYAQANPATLIDPTGHTACSNADLCDESMAIRYRHTTSGSAAARRMKVGVTRARHHAARHVLRATAYGRDENNVLAGVGDAAWRFTGGFVEEGLSSAAFLGQHLDKLPEALGMTAGQAWDAGGNALGTAGDIATHLDQLPDRTAGLAYDMNHNFFAGVEAYQQMSPRQQADFATTVTITGVTAAQGLSGQSGQRRH
jgi:hypothetical protein